MRTSSYTIYVDLPDSDDVVLLVHGYSGAYDIVSRDIATYLRSRETRRPPAPLYGAWTPEPQLQSGEHSEPSAEVISLLRKRGYLTDLSENGEEAYFSEVVEALHHRESIGPPAVILMVTYDCNLRCGYCFQDHMRTDPAYRHLLRTMDRPMVDRILCALPDIEAVHGIQAGADVPRSITLFGGEPLLASNRPIVEYIISQVLAQGVASFSAITNGTDLIAYKDLLHPDRLAALQITVDGPAEQHDRRRIYADGSGSFGRIATNITMALDLGVKVQVRTNVDRRNVEALPRLADEIIRNGWDRYDNFVAYVAPISQGEHIPATLQIQRSRDCLRKQSEPPDRGSIFNSWELDRRLVAMREQYDCLRVIARPDDGLRSRMSKIFHEDQKASPSVKSTYCGAHGRMYVFDPFGDIYACWEKTGDARIRIGRVTTDGHVESEVLQTVWRSRTVGSNRVCRQCRFALYCGGGCAVRAMNSSGTLHSNYCDGFAARFRATAAEALIAHHTGRENPIKSRQEAPCS